MSSIQTFRAQGGSRPYYCVHIHVKGQQDPPPVLLPASCSTLTHPHTRPPTDLRRTGRSLGTCRAPRPPCLPSCPPPPRPPLTWSPAFSRTEERDGDSARPRGFPLDPPAALSCGWWPPRVGEAGETEQHPRGLQRKAGSAAVTPVPRRPLRQTKVCWGWKRRWKGWGWIRKR